MTFKKNHLFCTYLHNAIYHVPIPKEKNPPSVKMCYYSNFGIMQPNNSLMQIVICCLLLRFLPHFSFRKTYRFLSSFPTTTSLHREWFLFFLPDFSYCLKHTHHQVQIRKLFPHIEKLLLHKGCHFSPLSQVRGFAKSSRSLENLYMIRNKMLT